MKFAAATLAAGILAISAGAAAQDQQPQATGAPIDLRQPERPAQPTGLLLPAIQKVRVIDPTPEAEKAGTAEEPTRRFEGSGPSMSRENPES